MGKNEFKIRKLWDKLSAYEGFVLYGAGYLSRLFMDESAEDKITPFYCVVTKREDNPIEVNGISVYTLEQKEEELRKRNILIVVAVTYPLETEIIHFLHKRGIPNVAAISEYRWNPFGKTFRELYLDKDFNWYVPRIKDWYYEQNGEELDIFSLLHNKNREENTVLFVIENLTPRVLKIINTIRDCGKKTVVFINKKIEKPLFLDMLRKISTDYYVYNQVEELFFLLLEKGNGKAHVFSSAWRIDIPYLLVKFQSIIGSVIFDEYDIANGFYTGFDECTLQLERYCLENACGVCYREFSLEHLTDFLQFDIKGKTIRFFDYCSKENKGTKTITEELSLCYAGGMITEEEYSDCPFAFSMELIEMFEKNRCHLHVYPSNWEENKFRTYVDKDRESKYFHFHKPVEYDKLPDELSHYDYGIVPVRDDVWENEESGYNTKYKYIYAATNKLFDYLDAGLPLIAGMPLKMAEYLEKKGVLLKWTNGQYDFDYLRAVKDDMQKQVEKIKEELNIKKQIGKLLAFYETL